MNSPGNPSDIPPGRCVPGVVAAATSAPRAPQTMRGRHPMQEERIPILQRLVGRVLLFGVIPAIAIVALIVAATLARSSDLIDRDARTVVTSAAAIVAGELSESDARAETAAAGLSMAVSGLERHASGSAFPLAVDELLRKTLEAMPDARAATISVGTVAREARRDAHAPGGVRIGAPTEAARGEIASLLRRLHDADERPTRSVTQLAPGETPAVLTAAPVIVASLGRGLAIVERSPQALLARLDAAAERYGATLTLALGGMQVLARGDGQPPSVVPIAGMPRERLLLTHIDAPGEVRCQRVDGAFVAVTRVGRDGRDGRDGWTVATDARPGQFGHDLQATLVANAAAATIAVLAVSAVMLLLARGVGRRLDEALATARRIAEGDLHAPAPRAEIVDESGALMSALGAMTDNLNRIVGQVQHASIRINSTATELAASSVRLESNASGFGASATEVAAATREISTTGEELLHTMQVVADSAAGAAEKAQESREGLQSMQQSVHRLDAAAETVATRLSTINEKAQGINAIVGTITKVAEETNLLSVNAAIEAEKAGEFGLGFLIVAREIRRLADQTAAATLDIERMIRQMQSAVSAGVDEMDRFGDSLRAVLDDVDRVGQRVQGIIAHVEDDTIRFVQVTEGMRSQTVGARQIDEAMRALSAGARQTIESAGEFGTASGELQGAIQSLKSAVGLMRLREGS